MRAMALVAAAVLLAPLGVSEVSAQSTKKPSAKCPANFIELCMKQCSGRGGQVRFCPRYCADREKEKCPR